MPYEPLITGIRVIDLLFPITKGGTFGVPGGFGTGKTVIQQSLAKWCNADVIVFVGCGERGNEIADVLNQFSELIDPQTKRPLLERIILIANTSNMPVSAREASIFSGVTIAEYFRDMGYDVAVLADSTSRWAESLREISGLLEEMPAEEGYPAYLPSRLSSFYERAGIVELLGNDLEENERIGSLTIIGSVSPPAGDFSEPVTATTKNFVQGIWALDAGLAYSKHYPAINWLDSYSNYPEYISEWWYERDLDWVESDIDWFDCRKQVNEILSKDNELKYITQLIGAENLPDEQQFIIFISKLIKEGFLIQNAFDEIDSFTNATKLLGMIKLILLIFKEGKELLKQGIMVDDIKGLNIINSILRMNRSIPNEEIHKLENLKNNLLSEIEALKLIRGVYKTK
jgi:V/A-type H+-transporting ATPase subunit A